MNDSHEIPEVDAPIPPNAMRLYGQSDAMDDFPVLKAFQQYIDAEHAKAQKRMVTLCIFFVVLMVSVIGLFVVLLMNMSSRNNSLSDQLFQFMLKDRDRQNAFVQSGSSQSDAAVKALAEMQQKMMDQQMKFAEEMMKNASRSATPGAIAEEEKARLDAIRAEREKAFAAENERLVKAQAELKAQRELVEKERERLKEREIEFQRRRLYPEYYEKKEGREATQPAAPAPVAATPAKTVQPDDADLAALDEELKRQESSLAPENNAPIRYFSYDDDDDLDAFVDSLEAPGRGKGTKANPVKVGSWDIPLE